MGLQMFWQRTLKCQKKIIIEEKKYTTGKSKKATLKVFICET